MSPRPDHIPRRYLDAAAKLIGAVHDEGIDEVNEAIAAAPDLRGLAITLAALVPDDRSFAELLEWNDNRYIREASPDHCDDVYVGTDTGYYRHLRVHRTLPCGACRTAHATAQRHRDARKRGVL